MTYNGAGACPKIRARILAQENYLLAMLPKAVRRGEARHLLRSAQIERVTKLARIIADIPPSFTLVAMLDSYGSTAPEVAQHRAAVDRIRAALEVVI